MPSLRRCAVSRNRDALRRELEAAVDAHGIAGVLDALTEVCMDKSEHVRATWQDDALGALWSRIARAVCRAETSQAVRDLAATEGR